MDADRLRDCLDAVRRGDVSVDDAVGQLAHMPFESLGFANVDHHRALRCGFPEVIYCPGKTTRQVVAIFESLAAQGGNVLATRVKPKQAKAVIKRFPDAAHHESARCVTLRQKPVSPSAGVIAIVAAGTSDLPVAEEARVTAEIMDQQVVTYYDVGVAGLHRLLQHTQALRQARVVVVVAGMEGALLSIVGGLVESPVIGVPTSVGYGASFNGLAPLLTMLNSCAAGTAVVNIDNGFGAGYLAASINRMVGAAAKQTEMATAESGERGAVARAAGASCKSLESDSIALTEKQASDDRNNA